MSAQIKVGSGGVNCKANFLGHSYTMLMAAADFGEETTVQLLLENGADPNITGGGNYRTALIAAAYWGRKEIAQLLLENGADVNITAGGNYGTALIAAAHLGRKDIVLMLLENGADPNITGGGYYGTALIAAVYHGGEEMAQLLLEKGADVNTACGSNYGTALIAAVYFGREEIVQMLLEEGADVNVTGGKYGTPLITAAYHGWKEIVLLLLENGADVNSTGGGNYGTALSTAAYHGRKEIALLLLENGADPNIVGSRSGAALVAAASTYRDPKEIVLLLLERGADPNITGGHYGTALITAAYHKREEIVLLLLENGADPTIVGGRYGTALIAATYCGCKEAVQLLLEKGIEVNCTGGGDYGTALITAAYARRKEIVLLLLEKGADINRSGDVKYGTALIAAAYHGRQEIVQLLLEKGADPNIGGGRYNNSALAAAVHRIAIDGSKNTGEELFGIVLALLEAGADPNTSYSVDWGRDYMNAIAMDSLDVARYTYGSSVWSLLGVALHACDTLARGRFRREFRDVVLMLLRKGAEFNTLELNSSCLAAVRDLAKRSYDRDMVSLIFQHGRDVNRLDEESWTLLGQAVLQKDHEMAELLLKQGADVNLGGGQYGTPLGQAILQKNHKMVELLLKHGADVNLGGGQYWTPLGQAVLQKDYTMAELLLKHGADVNLGGGEYGTPLGVVMAVSQEDRRMAELLLGRGANVNEKGGKYGGPVGVAFALGSMEMVSLVLEWGGRVTEDYGTGLSRAASAGNTAVVSGMLELGVDINKVDGKYGTALGAAVSGGHKETVLMLLEQGASVMRVGGWYHTALGTYPTALDSAASPGRDKDVQTGLLTLLAEYAKAQDQIPWPPFPMPYAGILESVYVQSTSDLVSLASPDQAEALQITAKHSFFHAGDDLTPDQAKVACQDLDKEVLISLLGALVGLDGATLEHLESWMRNDIQYFISHGFDFGLAYAAARVAWNDFNSQSDGDVARYRYRWLERAEHLDKARAMEVSKDSAGQELIKAPYSVMPRRVWDLKSNRVVAYSMLHAKSQATHMMENPAPESALARPPFWAISHSWTDDMEAIDTPINGYQWPVPLPRNINLEGVRKDLIGLGAEYVWLDVLCLRQHSYNPTLATSTEQLKQEEWKLDVPTIGNVYRAAERVVRYFNGLGMAFTEHGWDSPRHWLRRAWTLQEIKTENTTYNACVVRANVLNTRGKVSGKDTTLRRAIRPVLRLAAEVDSPGGCSVYELAREMAKRYSTQPTDKVAGLLYLLRTSELPTYDQSITDEDAWAKCIPLLPLGRKIELLFDFPYRGLIPGGWFPTWKQVLGWPERDPDLEHTRSGLQKDGVFELFPTPGTKVPPTEFICKVWAVSNVFFQETGDPNDFEVKIADKVFGFYPPYLAQEPIKISNDEPFTLTTMFLGQSHNWVVCEHIGEWKEKYKPGEKNEQKEILVDVDVVILRKIGVLRTDSCSELMVVGGKHKLKQINSVFV